MIFLIKNDFFFHLLKKLKNNKDRKDYKDYKNNFVFKKICGILIIIQENKIFIHC
jgi:hypothetical protein